MVTVAQVQDSLKGDRRGTTSYRQKISAIKMLKQRDEALKRGNRSRAKFLDNRVNKLAVFGGRKRVIRGPPTAPQKAVVITDSTGKVTFASKEVLEKQPGLIGKRISSRQARAISGGVAGTISKKEAEIEIAKGRIRAKQSNKLVRNRIAATKLIEKKERSGEKITAKDVLLAAFGKTRVNLERELTPSILREIQRIDRIVPQSRQATRAIIVSAKSNRVKEQLALVLKKNDALVKNIRFLQSLRLKKTQKRISKSDSNITKQLEAAERRSRARKSFNSLIKSKLPSLITSGTTGRRVSGLDGISKKTKDLVRPILISEKGFIGSMAFGSEIAKIIDKSTAIGLIVAGNAIEAQKKGRGKEFLIETAKQLKSQNKASVKAAKEGIGVALKEPSTYLLIPEVSLLKGGIALGAVKAARKGGKTVTRTAKTPSGKTVIVSREKIIRFGDRKLKVFQDKDGYRVDIVPKGAAKTLKGEHGRTPTPTQRVVRTGREKIDVKATAFKKGSGRVDFLTKKGTVKISRVTKSFSNRVSKVVSRTQKVISENVKSGATTKVIAKIQSKNIREFSKLSNKIAQKRATGAEIRRFQKLQGSKIVKSMLRGLSSLEQRPFGQTFTGVRGVVTQGRSRVQEAIRLKLLKQKKARTQLVGIPLRKLKPNTKLEGNVLTGIDAKRIPVISNAASGRPGTLFIVESTASKTFRFKSNLTKKNVALFRENQLTRARIRLTKKKAVLLGSVVGSIIGSLSKSVKAQVTLLKSNLTTATVSDLSRASITNFIVDIKLSPATMSKEDADQILRVIPSQALSTQIKTVKLPKVPRKGVRGTKVDSVSRFSKIPKSRVPGRPPVRRKPTQPKQKPKLLLLPRVKLNWETKLKKGNVFLADYAVRIGGKRRVFKRSFPKNRTLKEALLRVDKTTARSFELILTGVGKGKDIPISKLLKKFRIRKGKDPRVLMFVEKAKYAIDNPGEVSRLKIARAKKARQKRSGKSGKRKK